jgi:hypothetical protein
MQIDEAAAVLPFGTRAGGQLARWSSGGLFVVGPSGPRGAKTRWVYEHRTLACGLPALGTIEEQLFRFRLENWDSAFPDVCFRLLQEVLRQGERGNRLQRRRRGGKQAQEAIKDNRRTAEKSFHRSEVLLSPAICQLGQDLKNI